MTPSEPPTEPVPPPRVPPPPVPPPPVPPADDTAAFQRFYQEDKSTGGHGPVYRLLIGWWRKDA